MFLVLKRTVLKDICVFRLIMLNKWRNKASQISILIVYKSNNDDYCIVIVLCDDSCTFHFNKATDFLMKIVFRQFKQQMGTWEALSWEHVQVSTRCIPIPIIGNNYSCDQNHNTFLLSYTSGLKQLNS